MTQVRIIAVSLSGQPVGEHCFLARYPDSMVTRARALRAQGWTLAAIAAELGPHFTTVSRWVNGSTRKPPAKVIAKRVKPVKRLEKAGVHPPPAPENQHDSPGTPQMTPDVPKNEHVGPFDDLA